jgi:hypothetical protein
MAYKYAPVQKAEFDSDALNPFSAIELSISPGAQQRATHGGNRAKHQSQSMHLATGIAALSSDRRAKSLNRNKWLLRILGVCCFVGRGVLFYEFSGGSMASNLSRKPDNSSSFNPNGDDVVEARQEKQGFMALEMALARLEDERFVSKGTAFVGTDANLGSVAAALGAAFLYNGVPSVIDAALVDEAATRWCIDRFQVAMPVCLLRRFCSRLMTSFLSLKKISPVFYVML